MSPYKHLVNSPFYIFLTGLFLLPLIYSVFPKVDYELVKVTFFQRWVEIFCLSAIIFRPEKIKLKKISHSWCAMSLLVFFGVALFSSYIGADYSKSFWGNSFRSDGLFTLFHGVLLFIFIQFVWDASWRKHTSHAIVLTSILASLYALGHALSSYIYGIAKYSPFEGIYGTIGHPAQLGGYLLLTLPFFFAVIYSASGFLPILAIIFTFSRFAIFGILLVPIIWLISRGVKLVHLRGVQLFVVYMAFSVCYFGFFAYKGRTITQEYIAGNNVVYEGRMRIYTKGFLGFLERPVLGYGYANFDKAFEAKEWPARIPKDVYVDKAHSNWLEVLTTTGIVGFMLYISFVMLLFNRLKCGSTSSPFNKALTISFFLYVLNAQVNVTSIAQDALFWSFAGIVARNEFR